MGIYGIYLYKSLTVAVETMHQPIERKVSEKRTEEVILEERKPFSLLMLGVDEREGDKGRSDTMIVLAVNPNKSSIKIVSIPRDTRTEIVGYGIEDKINHAYAFGGEEMSMATVESLLDIPIDYYVKMNMEGFKDIVDAIGGITVNNKLAFAQDGFHFAEGSIPLNGEQALSYVRMRKNDPEGDFGRQQRQRQIIQGVINKGASVSSITRFEPILEALGKNIRTNLQFSEMVDIQKNYRNAVKNVEQLQITGEGQIINRIYYQIVPEDVLMKIQLKLKEQLEMS